MSGDIFYYQIWVEGVPLPPRGQGCCRLPYGAQDGPTTAI